MENDNLVCPYCVHTDYDSWEVFRDDEEDKLTTCGSCDRPFWASQHVSVTYTARKLTPTEEAEHGKA